MSDLSGVYNFVTGEFYDRLPATDEEAMQCLPDETARNYYDLRRKMGDSILDAWVCVLKVIVGAHSESEGETMDWQDILDTLVEAKRVEAMKTSPQLILGELIAKLEDIEDKSKPVIFNEVYHPTGIESWRGSYCELALTYATSGTKPSTADFIALLKRTIGETFTGYKGGQYLMGKTTPVWVANYGESHGFTHDGDTWTQAVVGVSEDTHYVIIETRNIEY